VLGDHMKRNKVRVFYEVDGIFPAQHSAGLIEKSLIGVRGGVRENESGFLRGHKRILLNG